MCIYPFRCEICSFRFLSFHRGNRDIGIEEDHRQYDRWEMSFPVLLSGDGVAGEGLVVNISAGGCSINTSSLVRVGAVVKLDLKISIDVAPVIVQAAEVRYIHGQMIGLEFTEWQQNERGRLLLFIRGLHIGQRMPSPFAR
jgi:hypothetical protein